MDTKEQDKRLQTSAENEDFDFTSLQGLSCGPEGCSLPEDFYTRKHKENEDDKDLSLIHI